MLARGKPSTKVSAPKACRDNNQMNEPMITKRDPKNPSINETKKKKTKQHRIHTTQNSRKSKITQNVRNSDPGPPVTKLSLSRIRIQCCASFAVTARHQANDKSENPKFRPKSPCTTRPWRCSNFVPRICGTISASKIDCLVSELATGKAISKSIGWIQRKSVKTPTKTSI